MIHIPAEFQIKLTIQPGSIYYFADDQALQSAEPHFWIVLNRAPKSDSALVLAVASSKIQKTQERAGRLGFPTETVVVITPADCSCFSVDSVVDCNSVFQNSIATLIQKLGEGKLRVRPEILPPSVVEQLVAGVLASPRTSGEIKKLLSV